MKRIFVVFLIALVAAGAWAGGQQGGSSTEGSLGSNFNRTGFPIVNEPVELSIAVNKHGQHGDIESIPLLQEYIKKTNLDVQLEISPPNGWNEKRNLILASGDMPDILGNVTPIDLSIYSSQSVFVSLSPYIEDGLAPNLLRILNLRPDYKKSMTLPDGHIYSYPKINELPFREAPENLFINKAWIDRLGLSMPESMEELRDVLKAFGEQDANGNGDRNDEIPFSFRVGTGNAWSGFALLGAWGISEENDNRLIVDNGKVSFVAADEGYREGFRWFSQVWDDGSVDPEIFTHTRKEYFAKGKANDDPIYGLYASWLYDTPVKKEWGRNEYVTLEPLPAVRGGAKPIWPRKAGQYLDITWSVVTSSSKYPEVAVRFLDGLLEERFTIEWARGPFGVVLEENDNGTISFIQPPEGFSDNQWRYANAPWILAWAVMAEEYQKMDIGEASIRKMNEDYPMLQEYLVPKENLYPQVFYTVEENERLATLKTDLVNYVDQMRAKWMTGAEDIDATWSGYLKKLNDMGLQDYLAIHQAAYDRYMEN
jgi:putative aldouronate transport system substrate-binding protein